MAAAGDERYLVCVVVAAAIVSGVTGSSSVFCNQWLFTCAYFYTLVESLVADRSVMAA